MYNVCNNFINNNMMGYRYGSMMGGYNRGFFGMGIMMLFTTILIGVIIYLLIKNTKNKSL